MDLHQTHPLQQQSSQQSSGQADANPQDVLAEARKNLQALIDSGISRDLLHQWVDSGNGPLQLSFLASNNFASLPPQQQQQQQQQQHHSAYAPPAPQCAPPPPPVRSMSDPAIIPVTSTSTVTTASPASTGLSSSTPPSLAGADMKSEILSDSNLVSATQPWAAVPSSSIPDGLMPVNEDDSVQNLNNQPVFLQPAFPYSHRPRISVSSTSSGSSGHASLWSVGSARSSMSWQSVSSARSQAPLPNPPTSSAASIISNSSQLSSASSNSKTNIYWCTSCDTSFKRKYDWKRHEDEFHERWRKYPCPEPGCNRSFWGSNSFNQHHKQCHNCTTCPHAEKVVKFLRKRKFWACGFCSALHPARERHVEHVARHFESGLSKNDWMHSRVVYGLLHQPLIHTAWENLVTSKQAEFGGRRPQFSWHPNKTGRAQGFLEKENPGQLQDLLEFFSGDETEAQWIVGQAYELADVVMTSAPTPSPQYGQSSMVAAAPFPQPETHIAFSQLPSQQPPQPHAMLGSSTGVGQQNAFNSPQFRSSVYTTSQFNTAHRASPDSSHSPLGLSSPPTVPSQSPADKRDLPALPMQAVDGMMDFEYSPAAAMFGSDWGNLSTEHLLGSQTQHQQQQQPASDWGMMQYFNDPRVTS
ncbi:hypothetical protein VHEMI05421 [[Torrubiella] hemipterigena]|uniref:C2H2-type domain-containing protein n=1 Tax=[Torrubiella] hemipterigena TaxID=1531966 RepID=A0A0A1TGL7_9HYPO|nr:hypothetical protein VHEMI05421 [[Torrubiella] hemipterigena]